MAGPGFGEGFGGAPDDEGDKPAPGQPADTGGTDRLVIEIFSLGLDASYELDLFGRVRGDYRAAQSDAAAAVEDFRAVQLTSAAEVIRAYFEIVDARRQIELTLLTADLIIDRVAQTEERFARGLAESFEVYQIRQDPRNMRASLPTREIQLNYVFARLALQLRETPAQTQAKA